MYNWEMFLELGVCSTVEYHCKPYKPAHMREDMLCKLVNRMPSRTWVSSFGAFLSIGYGGECKFFPDVGHDVHQDITSCFLAKPARPSDKFMLIVRGVR